MKTRILFVDDEDLVLAGLQRMLRSMRQEWEMEFMESAEKALERMKEVPFDVVVSDMRMSGMNGAEFLNAVMTLYPQTIRLILSGHSDPKLIMQCLGSTHQVLLKPCDSDTLQSVVLRAAKLRASMRSDKLMQIVGKMDRLPSIPSLYVELIEMMRNPDASIEAIGRLIAKDMGMTAKILKLVNSAFFGIQRRVASTVDATNYLGVEMIRSLVLSIHAFSQFESVQVNGFSVDALWSHSLRTATAANLIACVEGNERSLCEEAFSGGMLHDVGKLVLAANFSDSYQEAMRVTQAKQMDYAKAEEQVFGANHAEVGGYLLGLWGLPAPVVDAITMHHAPEPLGQVLFTPLTAVHAANALIHQMAGEGDPSQGTLDLSYLAALGYSERPTFWIEELGKNSKNHPASQRCFS